MLSSLSRWPSAWRLIVHLNWNSWDVTYLGYTFISFSLTVCLSANCSFDFKVIQLFCSTDCLWPWVVQGSQNHLNIEPKEITYFFLSDNWFKYLRIEVLESEVVLIVDQIVVVFWPPFPMIIKYMLNTRAFRTKLSIHEWMVRYEWDEASKKR